MKHKPINRREDDSTLTFPFTLNFSDQSSAKMAFSARTENQITFPRPVENTIIAERLDFSDGKAGRL